MYTIPNLKYKTTLCRDWLEGNPCEKGPNCYFAHGQQELRKIQDNQQFIASRNIFYLQYPQSNNYKTVYCKFFAKGAFIFQQGQCKLGASCTFAHQKGQKRRLNKPNHYQQIQTIVYPQYQMPFFYPQYVNFWPDVYGNQSIEPLENLQSSVEKVREIQESGQKCEIQSKSEQKKRSRIEERSTNQKESEEIQNEEELSKSRNKNECFNFQ